MATTTKSLVQKLTEITGDLKPMEKGGYNQAQRFAFIEVNDMLDALRPMLTKHGVLIYPGPSTETVEARDRIDRNTGTVTGSSAAVWIKVEWVVTDGESVLDPRPVTYGEAHDTGDKALNKAQTAALKQLLMKLFKISAESDNDASPAIEDAAPRARSAPASNGAQGSRNLANSKKCPEHGMVWSKTSRGTNAHPVKDADGKVLSWCDQQEWEAREMKPADGQPAEDVAQLPW